MHLGKLCGVLAVSAALLITPAAAVKAAPLAATAIPSIPLVTELEDVSDDVYFVKNKKKSDPATFNWVAGKNGKALQLDGDTQHVRLATARVRELTGFTFSAFVNWAGIPEGSTREQRLLSVFKNDTHCLTVSPHNTDASRGLNGIELTLEDPQTEPISLYHEVASGVQSALRTEEWHHIAVTLSDSQVALYIDGTVYVSKALENFSVDKMDLYRFVIGSEFEGDAQFNGMLDDAVLYTAPLTADQIALLAQGGDPNSGETVTTAKEILATRPVTTDNSQTDDEDTRILGLPPTLVAILGSGVLVVIALSLILSFARGKVGPAEEDDHP